MNEYDLNIKEISEIINSQIEWIKNKFGDNKYANLGWSVGDNAVVSKIYGKDGGFLDSHQEGGEIVHSFVPFGN